MKRILELLALAAVIACIAALTGCEGEDKNTEAGEADAREQVSYERDLRTGAEARAEKASSKQAYLRGVVLLLFIGALAAFVGGSALGSKARNDAEPN